MPQKDVSDDSDFNGASSSSLFSTSTSDTFPQNVSHRRLSVRYFMFPSSSPLASSSCVCLVFVLNMDCVCVCLFVCVCVSQFVVEIVLLISYECQRWRRRRRRRWWALLGTRFSFRWKQEWFAPSQKLVRCCDPLPPPLPSPHTTLWSPLDRIAVWLEKPQEIFHRQFFKVCLVFWYLVRISFSKLSRTRLHGKQFEPTKGSGNKEIQGN